MQSSTSTKGDKIQEYVSLLIGLYKDNGSVSCVAIYFFFIWPVYLAKDMGMQ